MPLALVDDNGTQLFYEDSGPPGDSSSYVTLVLVHGGVFHGAIYQPMFPFAAKHNLRLVSVTLRDYPGSTPFTPSELAALKGNRDSQATLIRGQGLELASFLLWFIQKEDIPRLSVESKPNQADDQTTGGLAILGWSWGNCMTLSLLAHAGDLPTPRQSLLGQYMRTLFLYDAPHFVFGTPDPPVEEPWRPLRDTAVAPERKGEIFPLWVSGYFPHSPTILSSFASISRADLLSGLVWSSIDNVPHQRPTLERMSSEQIAETVDYTVIQRSWYPMTKVDRSIYHDNTRRALCDATVWPHLRTVLVWCDMSVGETVYGAWVMARMYADAWPSIGRKVHMEKMEGANHFPHWDQPERTVEFLAHLI